MSKSRFSCQIYSKLYFSWHARKIFKYQISWNSVSAYRPTHRNDEANSRISQFDAPNKEPFLSTFSQTQEVSITQVGNFVETRLLAVALRGLLEKYPTFGREKETGLPGALDT